MRSAAWDRDAVVAELRGSIWLHLTPASTGTQVLLDAAALLRLPDDDAATLADLHLVLHPAVGALLDAAPGLLRWLRSDTARTTETGLGGVRGPVDWPATSRRRALDRTPVVVAHPNVRDRDVNPARLLALLVGQVRDRAAALDMHRTRQGTTGATVTERGRLAASLAAHRALAGVTPAAPTARDLQAMAHPRFARRHRPLLDAWAVYDALVHRADREAARRAVERHGLAAADDGALFEVLVLFRLRDALARQGWHLVPLRPFRGGLRFTARRDAGRLYAVYQGTPAPLAATSRYLAAQRAHGLTAPHDLRPDLVLRHEPAGRDPSWLLVEAKTSTSGKAVGTLVRRAIADLLAYRWAYEAHLSGQDAWGLGVVWGTGLTAADYDVRVCTPDRLALALAHLLPAG